MLTITNASKAIRNYQLKRRCSQISIQSDETEVETDAMIEALKLPREGEAMTRRQRSKLVAYCTDTANSHGVRVALAFEYDMEHLVTNNGYAQTNMVFANVQQMRAQLAGGRGSPQLQMTPGMSNGMNGMALTTPTATARAALAFGGGTSLPNPRTRG